MLKACVIGWPIEHSRSPLIHNFWLKKYGLNGIYEKITVEPENLKSFIADLQNGPFSGCNVTLPHKEDVAGLVTIEDELTKRIGAVNTVYIRDNNLYGLNTDGYGFISNLKHGHKGLSLEGAHSVVIGAGGASRAIIAVLLAQNVKQISLVNRTLEKAQALANHFGDAVVPVVFDNLEKVLKTADLLVNTTSLGMAGQSDLEIDLTKLPITCLVTDIVYTPLETSLIKQAKARGNITVDGLGMLLHQAAPGFEKWFGVLPEVTLELRNLIVADLGEN